MDPLNLLGIGYFINTLFSLEVCTNENISMGNNISVILNTLIF